MLSRSLLWKTSRRKFINAIGLSGLGLSLPSLLQRRAAAAARGGNAADTAVICIQLGGGASQFETYDPKPDAPLEYRGASKPVATSVPGIFLCELLPRQAAIMDKLAVVRSVYHEQASHIATHLIETGYQLKNSTNARRGEMPSVGSIAARCRTGVKRDLPAFMSLPGAQAYSNPHYLGAKYDAFNINEDPSLPGFRIQNTVLDPRISGERLSGRRQLWHGLNQAAWFDAPKGQVQAMDSFTRQAFDLLLGERMQTAVAIEREASTTQDAYGRNTFGQRLLLARRLVESGVPFVMVRTFDWDDHDALDAKMRARTPAFDQGLAALVDDLHARGLNRRVLVVAMGEFGRTPRVNAKGGRDHWPALMSVLLAGGNYRMGQVIGASDAKGAAAADAPYRPENVLGMVYRHLGIDPMSTFDDLSGRPRPILEECRPIQELI